MTLMEILLHYVWKHKLFPLGPLTTVDGQEVDVIDPGLHNRHQGPDFFNAKVKIGGTLWVGNVEIHDAASDWYRHHHDADEAYDNVVLHVVERSDMAVQTQQGRTLPQLVLEVPETVRQNYAELLAEEAYPPCYRVIPDVPTLTAHSWLNALTIERLEAKTNRILSYLQQTEGDWERTFFVTLARNFGFGTNADAFEQWALQLPPRTIAKHRDNALQVEAAFFGQAGLLDDNLVPEERRDDYYRRLQGEYAFLAHKFSLTPMNPRLWKFLRMRPQNFPHVRLAQLSTLYHTGHTDLSHLLEGQTREDFHRLFRTATSPYWETHYQFGMASAAHSKALQTTGGAYALRLWPTAHGRRTLSTGLRPAGIGTPRAQFHHTLVGKSRPHRRQRRGQPGSHTTETRILRPERLPEMPLRRRIPQKKVSTIAHRTYLST